MADPRLPAAASGPCPDCGVTPGQPHDSNCDVARCLVTGLQRLSCSTIIFPPGASPDLALAAGDFEFGDAHPGEDCGQDVWAGQWPGDAECQEYGFWARFTDRGWVTCDRGDPGAREDLNRLVTECSWDRNLRRWVRDADAVMTALYRELDQYGLPSDPAFDLEAGFRDLASRLAATAGQGEPTPVIRVKVHPACGHDWTETRPAGMILPQDGELRTCGRLGCHPAEFPVTYTNLTELEP